MYQAWEWIVIKKKTGKKLQGVHPRKFLNKETHLKHLGTIWSITKMVLGDKKRKSVKKLKTLMSDVHSKQEYNWFIEF